MEQSQGRHLALFDFDGTLVRLAVDWPGLRRTLAALAAEVGAEADGSLVDVVVRLEADPEVGPRVVDAVTSAELAGLARAIDVPRGVALYRELSAAAATVGVVSHNHRAVIDAFFAARGLPAPDMVLDLAALGGRKDASDAVLRYRDRVGPSSVTVVGDSDFDRSLATALSATFVDVTS